MLRLGTASVGHKQTDDNRPESGRVPTSRPHLLSCRGQLIEWHFEMTPFRWPAIATWSTLSQGHFRSQQPIHRRHSTKVA